MDSIVVPLLSRRFERARILQKANHIIPAAGLLVTGAQALVEGARGFGLALAVIEIGTSAMLGLTIVRSLRVLQRDKSGEHSHGVDWIDIWAAGVLFAEAAERWHLKHHISRPTILTGLVTLALGLFHQQLTTFRQRRRTVRITADGIFVGGKPFRALSAGWRDAASITETGQVAEVRTRGGRVRRVDLADLKNAEEVRVAFAEGRKRLAVLNAPEPGERDLTPVRPQP
jgi:hypothetical protein